LIEKTEYQFNQKSRLAQGLKGLVETWHHYNKPVGFIGLLPRDILLQHTEKNAFQFPSGKCPGDW
jgi:hypothetical protein